MARRRSTTAHIRTARICIAFIHHPCSTVSAAANSTGTPSDSAVRSYNSAVNAATTCIRHNSTVNAAVTSSTGTCSGHSSDPGSDPTMRSHSTANGNPRRCL